MNRQAFLLTAVLLAFSSSAQEPPFDEDLEAVPELLDEPPPEMEPGGEAMEPEVTIIRRESAIIREYRVNGQLYMIQVVPTKGRPYYVVDSDGDGELDLRGDGLQPPEAFQWLLFSW
jgi:hypothetical protein